MPDTITIKKAAFGKLIDTVLKPNPDDPGDPTNPFGPYGPIGPVGRAWWVMLNPQPLPPKDSPWRAAFSARAVIDRVVAQYQMVELLADDGRASGALEHLRGSVLELVEEICGNRPPRWPWPWPKGDPEQLDPTDLLVMGAEFQKAAAFDSPLQADFAAAADQLFETGLRQLDNG